MVDDGDEGVVDDFDEDHFEVVFDEVVFDEVAQVGVGNIKNNKSSFFL